MNKFVIIKFTRFMSLSSFHPAMFSNIHDLKIVDIIVGFVTIFMMNLLSWSKFFPQVVFHNTSMLKNLFSANVIFHITLGIVSISALPIGMLFTNNPTLMYASAFSTTQTMFNSFKMTRFIEFFYSANFAFVFFLHKFSAHKNYHNIMVYKCT